jgi:hypothetical protein
MTDQQDRDRNQGGSQMDSVSGQGTDEDAQSVSGSGALGTSGTGGNGDLDAGGPSGTSAGLGGGLGNATPGAGSNWTPGNTSGSEHSSDAMLGGQGETGQWGNRSGSGSGGEGEREMTEDGSLSGDVSDDIAGSPGTNG